ncbi:phage head morphogenesis protein [Vibrio fluvialis]|uniref:phage minor head protein n=1 Tax=Vibrio fluvialis TaxID=676 RepID=UPI00192BF374|nr:phage minor head protein [Vibrio fluvialis]MBL4278842.1 phage head morphogenesis protein [Vibrio fluvialis]
MATKPKGPILPRNIEDPTGVDRLERGAMLRYKEKLSRIGREYPALIQRLNPQLAVNARYTYELDEATLNYILSQGNLLIDEILLEGGQQSPWLYEKYVSVAYQRGTGQEFANLSAQSPAYAAEVENLRELINSEPYRLRIGLVKSRVFEEMKGLSATVKADMAGVLTDGIARGLNPSEVARALKVRAGLEEYRANRIARTEITTALRRARWDESESAQVRFGLTTMQLHLSALSPTTRITHAQRHAKLFTVDEVRDWYATGSNSINCKCSQVAVLVDDEGNPINESIIDRAEKMLKKSKFATNKKCSCCH